MRVVLTLVEGCHLYLHRGAFEELEHTERACEGARRNAEDGEVERLAKPCEKEVADGPKWHFMFLGRCADTGCLRRTLQAVNL